MITTDFRWRKTASTQLEGSSEDTETSAMAIGMIQARAKENLSKGMK
jgi:hypothetical protein